MSEENIDQKNELSLADDSQDVDPSLSILDSSVDGKTLIEAQLRLRELNSREAIEHRKLDLEAQKILLETQRFQHQAKMDERKLDQDYTQNEQRNDHEDRRLDIEEERLHQATERTERESKSRERVAFIYALTSKPMLFAIALVLILIIFGTSFGINKLLFVKPQHDAGYYENKPYTEMMAELKKDGFINVKATPIDDPDFHLFGIGSKDYLVKSITIHGESNFKKNQSFTRFAEVIVTYYQKKQ